MNTKLRKKILTITVIATITMVIMGMLAPLMVIPGK